MKESIGLVEKDSPSTLLPLLAILQEFVSMDQELIGLL